MRRITTERTIEAALTRAWREQVAPCCAGPNGGAVIDVGANFGWYSLYSLALGCRVLAFEPVGVWREAIELGVALNGGTFARRLRLLPAVVHPIHGIFTMWVPEWRPHPSGAGAGGQLQMGMTTLLEPGAQAVVKRVARGAAQNTSAVRIDDVAGSFLGPTQRVCMLKADVEGFEPQVLTTAQQLLRGGRVAALQLELTRAVHGPRRQANNQTYALAVTPLPSHTHCAFTRRGPLRARPRAQSTSDAVAFAVSRGLRKAPPALRQVRQHQDARASGGARLRTGLRRLGGDARQGVLPRPPRACARSAPYPIARHSTCTRMRMHVQHAACSMHAHMQMRTRVASAPRPGRCAASRRERRPKSRARGTLTRCASRTCVTSSSRPILSRGGGPTAGADGVRGLSRQPAGQRCSATCARMAWRAESARTPCSNIPRREGDGHSQNSTVLGRSLACVTYASPR